LTNQRKKPKYLYTSVAYPTIAGHEFVW